MAEVVALADLLLVDGDPVADIALLSDPEKTLLVIMKDGRSITNMPTAKQAPATESEVGRAAVFRRQVLPPHPARDKGIVACFLSGRFPPCPWVAFRQIFQSCRFFAGCFWWRALLIARDIPVQGLLSGVALAPGRPTRGQSQGFQSVTAMVRAN